jgi:uncharacterized repeat protein (TIGR01451 family)
MARRLDSAVLGLALLALLGGATSAGAQWRSHQAAQRVMVQELPRQTIRARLEKRADFPVPLCPGGTIIYTLTLFNNSDPGTGVQPAGIVDPIPAGTSYIAGSVTGGGVYEPGANRITWTGALGPGDSHVVTFAVTVSPFVVTGDLILPLPDVIVNDAGGALGPLAGPVSLPLDLTCTPQVPCRIEIEGRVEDWFGNGMRHTGEPYPISNARVWLLSLGLDPLPIDPLSKKQRKPSVETATNHTEETNFGRERFPRPEEARYDIDRTFAVDFESGLFCPPRVAVASFLWDDDGLFAVSSDNLIGQRYVPLYLARCLSLVPSEVEGEGARCLAWEPVGPNHFRAEASFTFGIDPTAEDSARVIGDPQHAQKPEQSEDWEARTDADALMGDGGHTYFFAYKSLRYLADVAGRIGLDLQPVLIQDRAAGGGAWTTPEKVKFGDLRETGDPSETLATVGIATDSSAPWDDNKPDNREWHELGHYWMLNLYGGHWPPGSETPDHGLCGTVPPNDSLRINHCGYANALTADSYVEGFAEFTSLLTAEHYQDPAPFRYRWEGGNPSLEIDYRVWGSFVASFDLVGNLLNFVSIAPGQEEFAAAGILWDLHDGGDLQFDNVREDKALGVISSQIRTGDAVALTDAAIYDLIDEQQPSTFEDLHRIFGMSFPQNTDGGQPADPVPDVSEIFIAHAAFDDVDPRNLVHDSGEAAGGTGSSRLPDRPDRENKPPDPRAYLIAHFVDGQGGAIDPEEITLEVEIEVLPPYAYYSYDYDTFPDSERVYLPLPPSYFPSVAHLRARWPAGGKVSLPFDLGSGTFWQQVAAGADHVDEHTFVLDQEAACVAGDYTLCLNQGRFQVEAVWATTQGTSGRGRVMPLTDDTGYFWFFHPDNVEVVLKVLKGCPVNDRFWVFAGGLTNVDVEITVTDTETGDFQIYHNPQSTPFQPILDTDAFATCSDGGSPQRSPEAAGDDALDALWWEALLGQKAPWLDSSLLPAAVPMATPALQQGGTTELMLNQGRFRVEATWATLQGTSGEGRAARLTDDTGYFWFFDPDNVEVVLKVLDACSFTDRYWVFAGGLTNVEVEITVTDTQTGDFKTYPNPQSTPFEPILDTDAFATCP